MKKLVSLFIVFILLLSICTMTAIAFAEEAESAEGAEGGEQAAEEEVRVVTFDSNEFWALDEVKSTKRLQDNNSEFKLACTWLLDAEKVAKVFPGIKYILKSTEGETDEKEKYSVTTESDKVIIEYCTPSKDYKEDWYSVNPGSTVSVTSTGWWAFRFVVKDGASAVLIHSERIDVYFADASAPVIKDLHSDMKKIAESGVVVGKIYTIKTNLSYEDDNSVTISYIVEKKVNGVWTQIYDSTVGEVAEGFEDGFKSGTITMLERDVLPDNAPIYRITYKATDSLGYVTETYADGKPVTLEIFAVAEEKEPISATKVWTIVLYCIAGASFIGIIVVLLIKPKEEPAVVGAPAAAKKSKKAQVFDDTEASEPVAEEPVEEPSEEVAEEPAEEVAEEPAEAPTEE